MQGKAKGRKGKLGRNKANIAAYFANGRDHLSRLRKLRRHVGRYVRVSKGPFGIPTDVLAAIKRHIAGLPPGALRDERKRLQQIGITV